MIKYMKNLVLVAKSKFKENSVDNLLWIVNIVPNLAGFSLLKDTISAPFWILHLSLIFYVYGVGTLVYQMYYAQGASDFIKSNVNVSLLVLIVNNSYWFLKERPLLRKVLKQLKENDNQARSNSNPQLRAKHEKILSVIKKILFVFYGFNLVDATFIYLPHRVDVKNDFSMTPCVGLEPLSASPNHEICLIILLAQEISIMTVVLNYQALFCLLIAHTAGMYQMLAVEMLMFDHPNVDRDHVRERLPYLIRRHSLTLDIINNLKSLYSMPIGVNFVSNAVCMMFFFYLPLQEWLGFIPILVYCFLVFFLYCFLCQKLINGAEMLERAVYGCGWENFDVNEQKLIYFMLLQAQMKVELLAADIVPVNIYTFATTLQGMFKFVTVVKF